MQMLMHVLGWAFASLTITWIGINAIFMLFSPQLWFQLPDWIRASGRFTSAKYSAGAGAMQVRILGAIVVSVLAFIVFNIVLGNH
jgi:hypothetical protein